MTVHPPVASYVQYAFLSRRHINRERVVGIIIVLIVFFHKIGKNIILHKLLFFPVPNGDAVPGSEKEHIIPLKFYQIGAPFKRYLFGQRPILHIYQIDRT